jgi:hypothetical protein
MLRLVQLNHPVQGRRVAVVQEPQLRLVDGPRSAYELAQAAIKAGRRIADVLHWTTEAPLSYDEIYDRPGPWTILPAFDHPTEPARCLVAGTGLTHNASAASRDAMHASAAQHEPLSDSMKMYRAGVAGGRPAAGEIGAMPEWFYKGNGTILRAHGEPLDSPNFAGDGGEEAEIAGCYLIGADGTPYRVGLTQANEFSDHVMEAKGYLHLAPSKLRTASIGPELVVDANFCDSEVTGETIIRRRGETVWRAELASGERWMCHSLANLEQHHFKYPAHRRPGDAHVHFLGADAFSFRDAVQLEDGDEMSISFTGFGRPLVNPLRIDRTPQKLVAVKVL